MSEKALEAAISAFEKTFDAMVRSGIASGGRYKTSVKAAIDAYLSALDRPEIAKRLEGWAQLAERMVPDEDCSDMAADLSAASALLSQPADTVPVRADVVRFLNGVDQIEGRWFGEQHKPKYWWRRYLPNPTKPGEGE